MKREAYIQYVADRTPEVKVLGMTRAEREVAFRRLYSRYRDTPQRALEYLAKHVIRNKPTL